MWSLLVILHVVTQFWRSRSLRTNPSHQTFRSEQVTILYFPVHVHKYPDMNNRHAIRRLKVAAASFTCHVWILRWCLQGYFKKKMEEQFQDQQKGLLARLAQLEAAAAAGKAAT